MQVIAPALRADPAWCVLGRHYDHRMNFRTADGASYQGRDDSGNERFSVSIPFDEHGYFGRECPACSQIFRMHGEDYDALPDDLMLICPYCGHSDDHGEFLTPQQRARVMRVAQDAAMQLISDALDKSFGSLGRSTRNNRFVKFTYRSKPFYPEPLPAIDEERLVRERKCAECEVRYAVFGEHRFCPVSGALSAPVVAEDALAAEQIKLAVLDDIPAEQRAALREQGVFDRLSVDTLGRVVGIVETFAGAEFRRRVSDADVTLRGTGNIFQRLDDTADLFATHLGVDPRNSSTIDWKELRRLWAARHAHVHADGRVDDRYLRLIPDSPLKAGQRIVVPTSDAIRAIQMAGELCVVLSEHGRPSAREPD